MEGYSYTTIEMEYEPIAAYSTDGSTQYASGGSYPVGVTIYWTTEGGITSMGWYTYRTESPFFKIEADLANADAGTINGYFASWAESADQKTRTDFVQSVISPSCWSL